MEKKITVIVNGRFHAFDYASELHKKGLLDKLISTMPYSKAKIFNIPRNKYSGFPILEAVKYLFRKLFKKELPLVLYSKLFNKLCLSKIPNTTEVIISFAGYSKEIFENNDNKIKILDRGSTHTINNIKLKELASKYHNTTFIPHNKSFIDREIEEYKLADYIMVPSSFVKKTFLENNINEHKIMLNPYGVSEKKFTNLDPTIERKDNVILFVGQLSPRKGIKVLIDAFKILKEKNSEIQLWLVGSINGINPDLLKVNGVKYFGVLSGKKLQNKFQSATLFCLPSFEEGLALVLTEAKYFNLPIVATSNSGVESLFEISENGYTLFETGNPIDLESKISNTLKDKNYHLNNKIVKNTWLDFTNKIIKSIN
jgi:glycosyltransferase involved in cell wall biosynthesis